MTERASAPEFVRRLTSRPGVYRMLDGDGNVIYIGKAGNLRKRVGSYFNRALDSPKSRAMLDQVRDIEVTVTRTEGEALLLESNLIKSLHPRYNVVFRDDKSYPCLFLEHGHAFPRLSFHRGARRGEGRYFGPFPSAASARSTLNLVQKLFQVRQCEDAYYRNRSRPCLQHQIGRCRAPCVGLVTAEDYAADVSDAELFLEGRNEEIIQRLTGPMERAAAALEFERAARYRDRIAALRRVQEQQVASVPHGECDVVAMAAEQGQACVQLFMIRAGRNLGNRGYFPHGGAHADGAGILQAFLTQYYLSGAGRGNIPAEILVSERPDGSSLLEQVFAAESGRRVAIRVPARGVKARWVALARDNAALALRQKLGSRARHQERLQQVAEALDLPAPPGRIECFDISHTQGEGAVGACVVFGAEGAIKSCYRRFKVAGITPGDDYAAMRQVLERRYRHAMSGSEPLPDMIVIDGGRGQVGVAAEALRALGLSDIPLVGVVKGTDRRPGQDALIISGAPSARRLAGGHGGMLLLQEIRDEAHRFAITGHRQGRQRRSGASVLERIPGIGAGRRRALLRHFGGLQGIMRAGTDDLAKVNGINKNLARRIYAGLHGDP
ncbi:MAG: excinuclease ABC subunit UvrC [Gammaproteobacteria bacterium]|nr:excinuclease ABC subunit UvrC [Gammaproteobacteria bacterium]